ncbi:MAG TPA: AMP-binding protein, partial [Acidimicrobiia bacterium]|nr:AMP-binding protein [Acidimicrobiia bacterium]
MKRTIPTLFRRAVDAAADSTWLLTGEGAYSYSQAMEEVDRAASALRAAGVGRGDRVLVTARNTHEYLLTWLALMEIGAVQIPLNPKSSRSELAGFVRQAAPSLVVTDSALVSIVDDAVDEAGVGVGRADVAELL